MYSLQRNYCLITARKYQEYSSTWAPPFQKNYCRNKAENELLEMEEKKNPNKKKQQPRERVRIRTRVNHTITALSLWDFTAEGRKGEWNLSEMLGQLPLLSSPLLLSWETADATVFHCKIFQEGSSESTATWEFGKQKVCTVRHDEGNRQCLLSLLTQLDDKVEKFPSEKLENTNSDLLTPPKMKV